MSFRRLLIAAAMLGAGCAAEVSEPSDLSGAIEASAPALGSADGSDRAERDCGIVLRGIDRRDAGSSWETILDNDGRGPQWWVWRGTVDVNQTALDAGQVPNVLYRGTDSGFFEVPADRAVSGAPSGYQRFEFAIWRQTMSPGWSATAIERTRIELVPFLRTEDGSRLFDHNRNAGDFENYVLDKSNGWKIGDAVGVCGAVAPRFHADWYGSPKVEITRYTSRPCANASSFDGTIGFEDWARQRAGSTLLCFEVYEPGVTDRDNPDLWKELDVQAHHRFGDSLGTGFSTEYVSRAGRVGNNEQYGFDLRHLDPFDIRNQDSRGCPNAALTVDSTRVDVTSDSPYVYGSATAQMYFTVNGDELRPAGGGTFAVKYEGYFLKSCLGL